MKWDLTRTRASKNFYQPPLNERGVVGPAGVPYAREKSRSSQIKPGLAELALKPLARGEAPAFRIPNLFKRDYFEWAPARRPTGKPVRPYDPAIRAVRPY